MKQTLISFASVSKELMNLHEKLVKKEANLEKKRAKAEKLGVAGMSNEEHLEWLKTVPTENGWIVNNADIKKNGAWFDLKRAEDDVEEIKGKIERTTKKFEKLAGEAEEIKAQEEAEEILKKKADTETMTFEEEKAEWAKDGINLERRYAGTTPKGNRFSIARNSGWTERSWHCFTLYINGNVIFTSGEFWRAYAEIMKH